MKCAVYSQRLALLYPKAIGDFMFVLPALHSIRHAFPEAWLTLIVKAKQAPLAIPQQGPLVNEVGVLGSSRSWRALRRYLAEHDRVIDLAGNDQTGLLLGWNRAPRLRPHHHDCKGWSACYSPWSPSFDPHPPGRHRVDELLAYAAQLGATEPACSFALTVPAQAQDTCEAMIERYALRHGTLVVLNVGASRNTKRWPAGHFRELARHLMAGGYRVVLTGARTFKADNHYDRAIAARFVEEGWVDGESCVNLITDHSCDPTLQLQRDTWFLRYSGVPCLTVGNDTGPLHIAGAVGADAQNKTLSLFGPTQWRRYAPYDPTRGNGTRESDGEWNRVLAFNPDCGPGPNREACPCYRRGDRHKRCPVTLDVETVFQSVEDILSGPT